MFSAKLLDLPVSIMVSQAIRTPLIPACASMILAARAMQDPNLVPERWHTFALTTLILISHAIIASMPTRLLARLNQSAAILNVISLFVFFIVVPAADINRPKMNTVSDVWGTLTNGTEWPVGIAVLMSFLGVIWIISGFDAPFHLTEECSNANVAAPWAIFMTSSIGGVLGWFVFLVIAYTVKDIDAVMGSNLGQPMASYLLQVLDSSVALGIFSLIIAGSYLSGLGCMIVSSRLVYAYARDGAIPGSQIWSMVNPRTRTPVYAGNLKFSIAP
jgi:amino acid transporter